MTRLDDKRASEAAEYMELCRRESNAWARLVGARRAFNDGRGVDGGGVTATEVEAAIAHWGRAVHALARWSVRDG